jgi:hypothetical protein
MTAIYYPQQDGTITRRIKAQTDSTVPAKGKVRTTGIVIIPDDEMWVWRNPKELAKLDAGLAAMAKGKTIPLGSMEEFADVELDA